MITLIQEIYPLGLNLMYNIKYYSNKFSKIFSQSLIFSLVTGMTLLGSIVPKVSGETFSVRLHYPVNAQDISDVDLNKYAEAILAMETSRQQSYSDIKKIIGEAPPEILCDKPSSYESLPVDAKKIAVDFCENSEKIVKKSGLSVSKFNQITRMAQSDQGLQQRLQTLMGSQAN